MKGRLTLEKVNAAINDIATYAEANAQIIAAPKKKVLFILCNFGIHSSYNFGTDPDSSVFFFLSS